MLSYGPILVAKYNFLVSLAKIYSMLPRWKRLDLSQLDEYIGRYSELHQEILSKRKHYVLMSVLEVVRNELG